MDAERRSSIAPDELLAQLGWMRTLARRLVFDPDTADDLLQEACLLALERGPDSQTGPGLRGWLARVTGRLAQHSGRTRLRQLRRETQAARPEALPSTLDIVEQREALRGLVEALTALEEPYYSTIVWRYFEGLSVEELAARAAITPAAVRQRLVRAKTQLRTRLERRIADDRSGWLVVALTGAPAKQAEAASLSTWGLGEVLGHSGNVLMAKTVSAASLLKLAAVLLVAIALGVLMWPHDGDRGEEAGAIDPRLAATRNLPEAPSPLRSDEPVPLEALLPAADVEASAGDPASSAIDPRLLPAVVRGRVQDESGSGVGGAEVLYVPDQRTVDLMGGPGSTPYSLDRLTLNEMPTTVTAGDGTFRLDVHRAVDSGDHFVPPPWTDSPTLFVTADGFALAAHACDEVVSGNCEVLIVLSVRSCRLTARVVDEAGSPLAGISTLVQWHPTATLREHPAYDRRSAGLFNKVTDSTGRIELHSLWPGSGEVIALSDQFARVQLDDLWASAGMTRNLGDIVMRRAGTIRGRVVETDGTPISGAEVYAVYPPEELAGMASEVGGKSFAEADVALAVLQHRLHQLRGLVTTRSPVTTDDQGRFERPGLERPTYSLFVEAEGFDPVIISDVASDGDQEVVMERSATIRLSATAGEGGARVPISTARAVRVPDVDLAQVLPESYLVEIPVTVAPDGVAVITNPGRFATSIDVGANGYATETFTLPGVKAPEFLDYVVPLTPEARVAGFVTDTRDVPQADAKVRLERPTVNEERRHVEQSTGSDGRFDLGGLVAGAWKLTVTKPGYLSHEAPVDVTSGSHQVGAVALQPAGAILGSVKTADGEPAVGVSVRFWSTLPSGSSKVKQRRTDEDGRFDSGDLEPNTYHVRAEPGAELDVELEAGEREEIDLQLQRRPTLRGRVLAAGIPQEGIEITLRPVSVNRYSFLEGTKHSDPEGQFFWELNDAGAYLLSAKPENGTATEPQSIELPWGRDVEATIELGTGLIEGRVEPLHVDELADVSVRLMTDKPVVGWTRVDAQGGFRFDSLLPGTYVVDASGGAGMDSSSAPIDLPAGASRRDLVIEMPEGARLEGRVEREGGDTKGYAVFVVRIDDRFSHRCLIHDGRYRVSGLGLGDYRVFVGPGWYDPKSPYAHTYRKMLDWKRVSAPVELHVDSVATHKLDLEGP